MGQHFPAPPRAPVPCQVWWVCLNLGRAGRRRCGRPARAEWAICKGKWMGVAGEGRESAGRERTRHACRGQKSAQRGCGGSKRGAGAQCCYVAELPQALRARSGLAKANFKRRKTRTFGGGERGGAFDIGRRAAKIRSLGEGNLLHLPSLQVGSWSAPGEQRRWCAGKGRRLLGDRIRQASWSLLLASSRRRGAQRHGLSSRLHLPIDTHAPSRHGGSADSEHHCCCRRRRHQ